MQFIILLAVDPGIRYERCKTKTITVLFIYNIVTDKAKNMKGQFL